MPGGEFIDSHAHLADPVFEHDLAQVIERARSAGASAIVCIGESLIAAERVRHLAGEHPEFLAWTVGIHPHDAGRFDATRDLPAIEEHLAGGAVAIGECGLDYHYDHASREAQRSALDAQLQLAAETGRPVVVHTRDADEDTGAVVSEAAGAGVRGVLHCFTGSRELADAAVEAGWLISFSGIVTFKRWNENDLVRAIPDDSLLVESDSPYLAPVPYRGHRNEPAWVVETIVKLARVRGTTPHRVATLTAANARRLFGLASPPLIA
ncbi:MAG: hypothetical protein NVS1B4_23950 [Gemmatimonadaceae bacterium]